MDLVHPAQAEKAAFDLVTLGPPALRDGLGHTPTGLGAGKPLALLCVLAVRGEVRRDEPLALLWGDVDEERARNAFRQALHRLRLALGEDVLVGDRHILRIIRDQRLRTDVAEFERAIDEGRFSDAVALYGGDFLEGFDVGSHAFDQWVNTERLRLRSRCISAAERAVQLALVDGTMDVAETAIRKILAVAPADARAIEVAASGFVSMGRRDQAAEALTEFARRASVEDEPMPRSLRSMLDRLQLLGGPHPTSERSRERPPFAGASELARLLAVWNSVGEDCGTTVVIEGPANSGKSRLVHEFAEGVRALGVAHVLQESEGQRGYTAPYAAVATALRPLVRAPGVAGASPHLLAEAARLLPELRDVFQLPAVEPIHAETERLRVYEGVAALLEAAAYERPVWLAVEDVHRASEPTLLLLGYLATRLRRSRVALVLTFDPDEVSREDALRLRALAGRAAMLDRDSAEVCHVLLSPLPAAKQTRSVQFAHFIERYFPNWRYLTGAAVATSLIAITLSVWGPVSPPAVISTTDTLVVAKAQESRRGLVRLVTSVEGSWHHVSEAAVRSVRRPGWVDSIGLPWVNALPSPNGRSVALERITPSGSNVYLISAERRDTIPLAAGDTEAFGLAWSPDGESFLVSRRRGIGGDYQLGLFAFPVSRARWPIPIDTFATHSVSEGAWSPDGSHIAWVARILGGQEEVFLSWADGSHRRNLSAHPASDYHIAWSADGSLLAFTSLRDGNAELYAYDLLGERLWRLTHDAAQDDRAAFDGDGRFVAFESTRGGAPEVYIMPSLGGTATHVGDSTSGYEIVGWRRSGTRYLDRLELSVPRATSRGDTVALHVRGLDQVGTPMDLWQTQWTVLDPGLLRALPNSNEASAAAQRFVALRDGLARVVVGVGSWRTDTAYIKIGAGPVTLLSDDFSGSVLAPRWRALGQPAPAIGSVVGDRFALVVNADRQWESGVLSSATVPVQSGLTLEVTLHAPFQTHAPATTATFALVAPDPPEAIDATAPRFLRLISVTWNADARRLIYAAEREVFAEAVPAGEENSRTLTVVVNADGTVTFLVDAVQRWRSTLRVLRADRATVGQLWLGGQDTGDRVAFGKVNVELARPR